MQEGVNPRTHPPELLLCAIFLWIQLVCEIEFVDSVGLSAMPSSSSSSHSSSSSSRQHSEDKKKRDHPHHHHSSSKQSSSKHDSEKKSGKSAGFQCSIKFNNSLPCPPSGPFFKTFGLSHPYEVRVAIIVIVDL